MIRKIVFLCIIASACCQYPRQIAPRPEVYADYDDYSPPPQRQQAPPPRQQAPPQSSRPNPRQSDILRPATVHYVNIGAELAGDYKFGYDTGKGNDGQSFREETRLPDGTVQGAYGYVDETGKQRIVKYTAGKDGFKVLKDGESQTAPRSAPVRQAEPAPQQAYRPPPQQAYAPQSRPQPVYRPEPQPQPAYRPPPAAQPAYRAPPAQHQQSTYRFQPSYAPEPQPRPQAPRPQYSPPQKNSNDESQDYDYPNNDISERRLVPIDTSLFNYNIGTSHGTTN